MTDAARARTFAVPLAMLAAAALLAPVAVRLALIAERDVAFSFPDLRGLYSDLAVSLFFLVALVLACRWTRWLAMVLAASWPIFDEQAFVQGKPRVKSVGHRVKISKNTLPTEAEIWVMSYR